MKNIITIQHTQSVHHMNGMVGSWTDWELTELGKGRAESIGKRLSAELGEGPCKIYCSDLLRAKQTAAPLARHMGLQPEYRKELREIYDGAEAIGKTKKWLVENRSPASLKPSIDNRPFDDAESIRDVFLRVSKFQEEILKDQDKTVVIVAHGIMLPLFFAAWLGLDTNMLLAFGFHGAAGGVSFLQETDEGKRVIMRLNDMSYSGEGYRVV